MTSGVTAQLATAAAQAWQPGGVPWWQAVGGILAVFALLVVFLRLLNRWARPSRDAAAAVLEVWPLGHRREIQILRLRDDVHYIYRHDSALVLLEKESHADYVAAAGGFAGQPAGRATRLLAGWGGIARRLRSAARSADLPRTAQDRSSAP